MPEEEQELSYEEELALLEDRQERELKEKTSKAFIRMHGMSEEEVEETRQDLAVEHAAQLKELAKKHKKAA